MKKGELRRKFFIAVFPPRDVAEKAEKIMLRGPRHWSWNKKENLHLSLAFPGFLFEDDVERLQTALGKVGHRAFDISLKGIGIFLDNKNKVKKQQEHVLWAKPDYRAENELKILHRKIITQMKAAGFKYGRDDFAPHMTLAKVEKDGIDLMKDFAAACGDEKMRRWKCGSFALYESIAKKDSTHPANNNNKGSKYKKVAEFKLMAAGPE